MGTDRAAALKAMDLRIANDLLGGVAFRAGYFKAALANALDAMREARRVIPDTLHASLARHKLDVQISIATQALAAVEALNGESADAA